MAVYLEFSMFFLKVSSKFHQLLHGFSKEFLGCSTLFATLHSPLCCAAASSSTLNSLPKCVGLWLRVLEVFLFMALPMAALLKFYKSAENPSDTVDLVTETDKVCEEIIFQHLKQIYPDHQFLGEETSAVYGTADLTDAPTWIIDPLDGTTNFVHRFPFVCVSIALSIGKTPIVAVVYNPILGELYTAIKGRGSFLNESPINSSSQVKMIKALLATGFGTKRDITTVEANADRIKGLIFKVRSVRMTGSCALNLCGVASGRLDLFYHFGYGGLWDVAAGVLIVQEAGGCVFDPSGDDFNVTSQRVAATNAHLKDALVDALRGKA